MKNNISSDCVYFLLFVTKIVIKEPRPIKGMALIITLYFKLFYFILYSCNIYVIVYVHCNAYVTMSHNHL